MYLHIGENEVIPLTSIISIVKCHPTKSVKTNSVKKFSKPFIAVGNISENKIKSYILTEEYLYGSPITLETLIKRYKNIFSRSQKFI